MFCGKPEEPCENIQIRRERGAHRVNAKVEAGHSQTDPDICPVIVFPPCLAPQAPSVFFLLTGLN